MFTWQRVAARTDAAPGPDLSADQTALLAAAPSYWPAFQRQQRLAAGLLRVHALSSALTYEPHAPLRVDAAHWWREIKQQSAAAAGQRASRKRRLRQHSRAADADAGLETDAVDEGQQAIQDLLVEALVRILHSLSAWDKTADADRSNDTADPETSQILSAVESAIGEVGVKLLEEWWRAPLAGDEDVDMEHENGEAAAQCGAQVVNVLLQFYEQVGSFHPFHDHKLCASTAQRLFRTAPRWSCSKCARSWETHTATAPILVFRCAPCDFTLCRECFTRIPNSTNELQEIALRRELFQVQEPLRTQRFVPIVLRKIVGHDKALFATLAPKLAIAARGRLQDLLLYRSQEMVPMMQMVLDLFSIPEFARVLIENEPQLWIPMYISSIKLRLYSFLGPLMWWTSMSDEPGEINLTPEGRLDRSSTALTLQWHEGYQRLRPMLGQLFDLLLSDQTQDPFVVDASLAYLSTMIVCFQGTRSSGQNSDLYDGILINLSTALVHVMLPMLESRSHLIQTIYHESFVPRRVYLTKPEPLRSKSSDEEPTLRAADDRRVQQVDAQLRAQLRAGESSSEHFYYPLNEKHFGVLCDFCLGADFVGLRYKCAVCMDADICGSCFEEFAKRPVLSEAEQTAEKARAPAQFHCTDHLFLRISVPVPLIAANHYFPVEFNKPALLYATESTDGSSPDTAEQIARELTCAECDSHLDQFDIYYRCSNCVEPRFVCPGCLNDEERHRHPNNAHLPGHLYMPVPRPWRQHFNPRGPGLLSRGLMYPACVYPRERFNTETELMYMTIEALHIGPLHTLSQLVTTVKEMHELRAFCACEEQRVEHEKKQPRTSGRRPPKLSAHYVASQARLAELGATRLMAEMHLLETSNVIDWITFYSRSCRWLLELASPAQNAFKTIVSRFSSAFSSFPQHFFFDVCDIVHVLTLDGTTGTSNGVGGLDYQTAMASQSDQASLLEPLLVMLVQLLATRKCTKNPHLRVQAAKALSSLVSFYAKNPTLIGTLRQVFQRCVVLRDFAVQAVLQFHEEMEGYHIRNNGLVFNNNAGSGDHLLWGFLSIRVTTALLLRFMWQFAEQQAELVRVFRMKNRAPYQAATVAGAPEVDTNAESHIANQVSMLLTGLWSDAAKLFEEGNSKAGVLIQLADVREALMEGRQIQLPFRPTMLEGYIALHSKHLRISMRMLVEVLELLSWIADNAQLKRAMLKPELVDQCARTTSFLLSSIGAAYKSDSLDCTWHHLTDSKRVFAHLVFLMSRCASVGSEANGKSSPSPSPSHFWSLVQESGNSMLRFIGDAEMHNRWTLNRAVVRMESARYLGEDLGDSFDRCKSDVGRSQLNDDEPIFAGEEDEELDENDALALLERQSAETLTTITSQGAVSAGGTGSGVKGQRGLARQLGNRFMSALAKDGRFDYEGFLAACELLLRTNKETNGSAAHVDSDRDYEFVGLSWMTLFMDVLRRCQDMVALQTLMDELLTDIPEEFLDPLLSTIMTDPVRLPSGNIVDRSVIERHLLSTNRVDPFTREPLTVQMLEPCDALRHQIRTFLRAKLQHLEHQREDVLATWGLAWDCIFDVVGDARS